MSFLGKKNFLKIEPKKAIFVGKTTRCICAVFGGVPLETLLLAQEQDTCIASKLTYILMAH